MSEEKNIERSSSQSPVDKAQARPDDPVERGPGDKPRNSELKNEKQKEKISQPESQPPAVAESLPQQTSNLSVEDLSKTGIEPQTTSMETHAHHLHKAPAKGWKHFLFEFLMLFLAVFAGFLAENQREELVEHNREKKLMRTLISDLKNDSANFEQSINIFHDIADRF